jgi:preprotein translocase subunit YajC
MSILIFLPLLLILMYLLLIRPQQQRVRKQQAVLSSIDVGDEVVTVSGIVGRVEALEDDRVYIEVAPGVTIEMLRQALGRKIEPPVPTDEHSDDEFPFPEEGSRQDKDGPEEIAG